MVFKLASELSFRAWSVRLLFTLFVGLLALPWHASVIWATSPVLEMAGWLAAGVVMATTLWLASFTPRGSDALRLPLLLGLSLLLAALLNVPVMQWLGVSGQAMVGEVTGALQQRNQLATLLMLAVLAGCMLIMLLSRSDGLRNAFSNGGSEGLGEGRGRRVGLTVAFTVFLYLALALIGVLLALTFSRTGGLQLMALIFLLLLWGWRAKSIGASQSMKRPIFFVLWALAWYVGAVLATPWIAHEAGQDQANVLARLADAQAYTRVQLWSNVLELIAQKPLLGHGWRSLAYLHYSTEFSHPRFMEMLDNAHNLPLHLAVELGLPVALLFCAAVGWLIWRNKPWAETKPDRQLAWGILLVIGIHSLVEYPLWYGPFFMTALLAVGILCGDLWRNWLNALNTSGRYAIVLGVRCLAALMLAGTVFVAFDYHRVSQIYLQPEQRSSWYKADPLAAAKKSVLFESQAKFAELQITPLSRESAPRIFELSSELVQWSPEPRIIEKLIESAVMLGRDDVAAFHLKRYKVAYPQAYALWAQRNR